MTQNANNPPCMTCRWWYYDSHWRPEEVGDCTHGDCRRHAPVVVDNEHRGQADQKHPRTRGEYGCGDHEPKPEEDKNGGRE